MTGEVIEVTNDSFVSCGTAATGNLGISVAILGCPADAVTAASITHNAVSQKFAVGKGPLFYVLRAKVTEDRIEWVGCAGHTESIMSKVGTRKD